MIALVRIGAVLVGTTLVLQAHAQIGGSGRDGVFAPSASQTLDTTPNGGVFEFTSINIPAGVAVTLTGPNPAVLRSQGPVVIAGSLLADGGLSSTISGGPGGYPGGRGGAPYSSGTSGGGPGGGAGGPYGPGIQPGSCASHATLSTGAGNTPLPPFGVLLLDPTAGIASMGLMPVAASGLDHRANLAIPVPNRASLSGLVVHLQALDFGAAGVAPRLSNRVTDHVR